MNLKALIATIIILLVLALVVFAAFNQEDAKLSKQTSGEESAAPSVEELQQDHLDEALADLEALDETVIGS